jgi:CheY-like chemotaxis protein
MPTLFKHNSRDGQQTKTILIVEDSQVQARRLELILTRAGLITLLARSGEDGLEMAQLHMPDTIVLDIELPGINGLQVCKYLKQNRRTSSIPIILLTQFSDEKTIELGLNVGAIEYIPKDGFSDAVLIETLRQTGVIED